MTTRKGMKVILFGAAVLLIAGITVSADEINERIPDIETTSIENPDDLIIAPNPNIIDHDASKGERGDLEDHPILEDEDILDSPLTGYDNLVAPDSDAEGDAFILGTVGQWESDNQVQSNAAPFSFPAVLTLSCVGIIGLLYIVSKRQK